MTSTAAPARVAWVAEITDMLDLTKWPTGSRVIIRRERPHPGAQLRFTDTDGHRFTAFITDTTGGQLADLETHHRSHARVERPLRESHRLAQPPVPGLRREQSVAGTGADRR
jgi:hypothetical protein